MFFTVGIAIHSAILAFNMEDKCSPDAVLGGPCLCLCLCQCRKQTHRQMKTHIPLGISYKTLWILQRPRAGFEDSDSDLSLELRFMFYHNKQNKQM